MNKKILLLSGDPKSVNSELIYKCWKKLNNSLKKKIYLISNYNLINHQFKKLRYPLKVVKVKDLNDTNDKNFLKVIDVNINFKEPFNISLKSRSKFVLKCLNYAHTLALNSSVSGIINCAIDKSLLNKEKIGVTEYLASKCKVKKNKEAMLIRNSKLSVLPITTHIDVKQVNKKINTDLIINKIKTVENWFKINFRKKPKIGVLGLNPHNAELRKNSEENMIIIPAIKKLATLGLKIDGPLASDTLFVNEYKKFDVVVGMFHDQVLGPFKAIFKFKAINITLGLKYLRVSPDHGTAVNLIGKNKANADSLFECINFVNKFGK